MVVVLTPGPGELHVVQVFVVTQHLTDQLKLLTTQSIHLTRFLGSQSVGDIKAKTKNQDTL